MEGKTEDELIRESEGFIIHMANKYRNPNVPYEDIFQVASIGFLMAIRKFDPTKNLKLTTYAGHWIMGEIFNYYNRHENKWNDTYSLDYIVANSQKSDREDTILDLISCPESYEDIAIGNVLSEQIIMGAHDIIDSSPYRYRPLLKTYLTGVLTGQRVSQTELGKRYGYAQKTISMILAGFKNEMRDRCTAM